MAFSFGFSGDDIDTAGDEAAAVRDAPEPAAPPAASAFPVPGKPQLPPTNHPLPGLLSQLPSKIAFSSLDVRLGDGTVMQIPRRELWDVRVQLMAEDDVQGEGGVEGLGDHDVKTGVYEGGFKSWESSVDMVKVLAAEGGMSSRPSGPVRVIELGCGTALPSLAMFQWAAREDPSSRPAFSFVTADYNPSVLRLVTLPNFILCWAVSQRDSTPALGEAFTEDGELELTPEVTGAFESFLSASGLRLTFLSGAWSPDFVDLVYSADSGPAPVSTVILGAETIYSPFALRAFSETVFAILQREKDTPDVSASAIVGAKRLYFGVGGSLDDFVADARDKGAVVAQLSEETEGVRRGVVRCSLEEGTSATEE